MSACGCVQLKQEELETLKSDFNQLKTEHEYVISSCSYFCMNDLWSWCFYYDSLPVTVFTFSWFKFMKPLLTSCHRLGFTICCIADYTCTKTNPLLYKCMLSLNFIFPPAVHIFLVLSFRPWMRPYIRRCVRTCILLAWHLTNQWTEFHQTLIDDVVEATNELIKFWTSSGQGQGHSEVTHLTELLPRAEVSTSALGRRSTI